MSDRVVVVGSINHDLTVVTPRHPLPGETIIGMGHYSGGGGKGANQAVAAARLGASVSMVGRVGDDEQGRALTRSLAGEGIDTSAIVADPSEPTGMALITLDEAAENTIVVSPGANSNLNEDQVSGSKDLIGQAAVVLAQLEIPLETVTVTSRLANGLFCLNPAPAVPLAAELLERVDILVPNLTELGILSGVAPSDVRSVISSARLISGPESVVVTMGSAGAVLVSGTDAHHIEAPEVEAIDSTGAGDAFCGALASSLARGVSLIEAVEYSVAVGALAVTRLGAQDSMPTLAEVAAAISA